MKTLLITTLLILAFPVMASERHDHRGEKGDTGAQGIPGKDGKDGAIINNYSVVNRYSKGVSSAMALSAQQYDWGVEAWQWSVSGSSFNNTNGFGVGLGKRFGKVLINANIATEEHSNKPAFNIGASGHF